MVTMELNKIYLRKPNKSTPYYRLEIENPMSTHLLIDKISKYGNFSYLSVGLSKSDLKFIIRLLKGLDK